MAIQRTADAIFCDDIRHEVGNKFSIMGMYGSDLVVRGRVPITIPKLALSVWMMFGIDDQIETFSIEVFMPPNGDLAVSSGGKMSAGNMPSELVEGANRIIVHQILELAPFIVMGEGFMEVMVSMDDETVRAARLLIRIVEPGSPA